MRISNAGKIWIVVFVLLVGWFIPLHGGSIIQSAYRTIQDEGVALAVRAVVNFTGAGVTCVDNVSGRTDCTIPGGVTSAYGTVQDNGSGLTARAILNFIGATCVDNAPSTRTDCTIAAGVTSVFGLTGAIGNLSGDCSTLGSTVVTCTKTNNVAFGSFATLSAPTVSLAFPWGETCCTAPSAAGFAWVNKQTADTLQTTADSETIFQQRGNATGVSGLRLRHAALPATPYTVTGCFMVNPQQSTSGGGLEIDDGTKVQATGVPASTTGTNTFVADFTTVNAAAARLSFSPANINTIGGVQCVRLTDNGTTRVWYFSGDYMRTWESHTNLSTTHTTTLTATNAGYSSQSTDGNYPASITIIHYRVDGTFFTSPNVF